MMLNAFGHCPFGGWIVVNDELTYLAGAHAMHIGEDYGGTKTNSIEVNDLLLYLAGTHAMDTVEDEGETNTNSLEVNDELPNSANAQWADCAV